MSGAGGRARLALLAVIVLAGGLRLRNVGWGLPEFQQPDETNQFLTLALRAERSGFRDLKPLLYFYPPGEAMGVAVAIRLCRWLPLADGGTCVERLDDTPRAALVARVWTALLSTATVPVLYVAARALVGPGVALVASLALAVTPFHALYAPVIGVDTPLTFWWTAGLTCAVLARRVGAQAWLVAAGFAVGMAAATKYPGILGLGPLLVAVVERRRGGERLAPLLALAAVGLAAGVLAGCPRCLVDAPTILHTLRYYWAVVLAEQRGWAGVDLPPGSPLAHHYVYQVAAILPYMLGWPLYLVALLGCWRIARTRGALRWYLGSLTLPYFAVMGAGTMAPPRWYMPLLPVFAIAAALVLDGWRRARGRMQPWARLAVAGVLVYSFAYAWSSTGAVTFATQRGTAAWLTERAAAASHPLRVGYPDRWLLPYDGLSALVTPAAVRWAFLPLPEHGTEPDYIEWLARVRPDVLVWPSFMETRVHRNFPGGTGAALLAGLEDGRLGYRLAATFPTHYLTEGLYTVLDPTFSTLWEVGLVGYRVFVREAPSP